MSAPTYKGQNLERTIPRVYTKRAWGDNWTFQPYLHCLLAHRAVFPEHSHADFLWHFGRLRRFGAPPITVQPILIREYFVKVTGLRAGFEELLWVGVIIDDQITYGRKSILSGTQELKAAGIEWFLDRITIDHAWVEHNNINYRIGWAPNFNDHPIGRRREVDVQTKKPIGNRWDAGLKFSADGELWNLRQCSDYLLENFIPANVPFEMGGQVIALEQFDSEIFEQQGMTVKRFMDRYVSRSRGIGCKIPLVDAGVVPIEVYTLTRTDITVGTKTLPANVQQTPFVVPATFPDANVVEIGAYRYAATECYDEILVQGSRIKVTATYGYEDETLERGWDPALETSYVTAGGGNDPLLRDEVRAKDRFRTVFAKHRLPRLWDGRAGDGQGGEKHYVIPNAEDDGSVALWAPETDGDGFWVFGKEFLATLPFKEGFDYSTSPPTDENPDGTEPEYRPLMVLLLDEDDLRYVYADRMSEKDSGRLNSCSVRPLDREFAVEVLSSPRHHIAGDPVVGFAGLSQYTQEIDYRWMIVTATHESDHRQHILVTRPNPRPNKLRLTIDVPEAEFWIADINTVIDTDDAGQPRRINAANTILRDDRPKLQAVTAFAEAYFFEPRQAVEILVHSISATPSISAELGTLITALIGQTVAFPVGAVVTSQTFDFRRQSTSTKTGYLTLDEMVSAGLLFAKSVETNMLQAVRPQLPPPGRWRI